MTTPMQQYSWILWGWVKKWMPLARRTNVPEEQARLDEAFTNILHPFTEAIYDHADRTTYVPHLLASAMAEVEEVLGQRAHDRERNVNFTAVSRGDSRVGAGGLSRHDRGPGSTPRGLVPEPLPEVYLKNMEPLLLNLPPEPDDEIVIPETTRIHVKGIGSRTAKTVSDVLKAGKLRAETAAQSAPSSETRKAGPSTEMGQSGIRTVKGSVGKMSSDGDARAEMPKTNDNEANKVVEATPLRRRAKRAGPSSKATIGDTDDEGYDANEMAGRGSTGAVKRKTIPSDKEGLSDAEKGKQWDGKGPGVTGGTHALKKRKVVPVSAKWSYPKELARDEDVKMESDSEPIIASSSSDRRCDACKKGDRPCSAIGTGNACANCKKSKIRCSLVIREVHRKAKEPIAEKKKSRPVAKKNIRLQSITRSMSQTADVSPAVNAASKSEIALGAIGAPHRLPPAVPVKISPAVQVAPTHSFLPSALQSTKATRPTVPKSKGGPKMEFAGVVLPVTKNGRRGEPERVAPAEKAFHGRQQKTTFLALNQSPTPPPDIGRGVDNSILLDAIKHVDEKVTGLMTVVDTIRAHMLEGMMAGPSHKSLEQGIMTSPRAMSMAGAQTSPIHLSRSPSPMVGMNPKIRGTRRPSPALSASTAFHGDPSLSPSPPPPTNALAADNTNRNDLDTSNITEAVGSLQLAREDGVDHEKMTITGKDVDMTVEKFQVGTGALPGLVNYDDDDDDAGVAQGEDIDMSMMDQERDVGKEDMEGLLEGEGNVFHADPGSNHAGFSPKKHFLPTSDVEQSRTDNQVNVGANLMAKIIGSMKKDHGVASIPAKSQGSSSSGSSPETHFLPTHDIEQPRKDNDVEQLIAQRLHDHPGFFPETPFLPTADVEQSRTDNKLHGGQQAMADFIARAKKDPGGASIAAKSRGSSSSSTRIFNECMNREAMASSPMEEPFSSRDPSPDPNGIPTDATSNQPHDVQNEDVADVGEDYTIDRGEDVEEDRDNMKIDGEMASPTYPPDGASADILQVDPKLLFGSGENVLGL